MAKSQTRLGCRGNPNSLCGERTDFRSWFRALPHSLASKDFLELAFIPPFSGENLSNRFIDSGCSGFRLLRSAKVQ